MALQVNWQQQQVTKQHMQQQQQQPGQQVLHDELVDAKQMGLWELSRGGSQEFRAATHSAQQPWVDLLQQCCRRTGHVLQRMNENSQLKAELLDHPEWQLAVQSEPSRSGYRDTPF
jgi:hypothetical protein